MEFVFWYHKKESSSSLSISFPLHYLLPFIIPNLPIYPPIIKTLYITHTCQYTRISDMVKLTIIGRMLDELPISQGPIYKDDDNNIIYKKHAEFLLHEISMDALPPSAATIFLHNQCFKYVTLFIFINLIHLK